MQLDQFQVSPALPEKLLGLREMAYNLLWTWDDDLRAVFRRLDRALWDQCYQNPVLLLGMISQQRLQELVRDDNFMSFYQRSYERMQEYLQEPTWWDKRYPDKPLIAYFSAEFGISESLPIYSGGLGVLSGDHMKGVSDLGVPLVGVGLLYQQGYFRQYLTSDGWQQESYPINDFYNLPVRQASDAQGQPVKVEVRVAGHNVKVQVWAAQVGRSTLYLLDTNLPENPREFQDITDQLYGGDHETRIRQEIVLGIGGLRALYALGLKPVVCHMNEGHSAFLSLERIRLIMKESGVNFWEALEVARAGGVFTTHTPVPAGFDVFAPDLMQKYFGEYAKEVGISWDEFLSLGRGNPRDPNEAFNMAVLALRTSAHANAVSKLHGTVSRKLFQRFFPELPEDEVPIGHVTNGVHVRNWVSREMHQLFDRYLGEEWWREPGNPATWQPVDDIPDEELWATHERRRERLVAVARQRLVKQLERRGASQAELDRARGVLDTNTLTIGFARRFATYKRANLILRDLERLKKILLNPQRPVQIIFAGKAHPRDTQGKEVLKSIVQFCQQDDVRRHAAFIEDYDLVVARYLMQGVDVWLNNPRRGLEASGTSGMKVVCNGGLNLSVLDGWWVEGYQHPEAGWAIGRGEEYADPNYQDYVESNLLYEILEKDVVPLFYDQGPDGLPRGWIAKMKKSMRLLGPTFSATRMLWEYSEKYYLPAARYYSHISEGTLQRARDLVKWKTALRQHWNEVKIEKVEARRDGRAKVGEEYEVVAEVRLGPINPSDVSVEVYYGRLTADRQLTDAQSLAMRVEKDLGTGRYLYLGSIPCEQSGMHGYTVRVRPHHPDLNHFAATGLITWR